MVMTLIGGFIAFCVWKALAKKPDSITPEK